jgi:hypothetical protein
MFSIFSILTFLKDQSSPRSIIPMCSFHGQILAKFLALQQAFWKYFVKNSILNFVLMSNNDNRFARTICFYLLDPSIDPFGEIIPSLCLR